MKKLLGLALVSAVLFSCGGGNQSQTTESKSKVELAAAGATFPAPFYTLAIKNYTEANGVLLTYGSIGPGGGIRSLKDKVVDFGATDGFIEDSKLGDFGAPIVHIPTCVGAVVIAYNLPGLSDIKLSTAALEGIFLGEITKWNDAQIAKDNAGVKLPSTVITFVHRSDGSGTTQIFSDYMSKVSDKWKNKVGAGKDLNWPAGIGAKGNPGVAGVIKQTEGAIGYIGSEYAFSQQIQFAQIANASGNFVKPTMESMSAAANCEVPADTRIMLTNSASADAYPIAGFTWIILYKEQAYNGRTESQATETVKFLSWLISADAQNIAKSVDYAPVPEKVTALSKEILKSITYNGAPILK